MKQKKNEESKTLEQKALEITNLGITNGVHGKPKLSMRGLRTAL
jgi:hypothetical protein